MGKSILYRNIQKGNGNEKDEKSTTLLYKYYSSTSSSSSSGGGISLVAFEVFYPSSSSSSFLSKVHSSFGCRVGFDGQLSFERPKYNVVVVVDDRPSGCCHFCRSCRESLASQKEEMKVGRNEKKTTIRSCLSHLRQGAVRDDVTSQSTSS